MSVTPAERKGYEERVRQIKEDADRHEAELVKQQTREVRNLQKAQAEELSKTENNFRDRADSLEKHDREIMDARDLKHQGDVENVREAYIGQLRKKMEDSTQERGQIETAYKRELESQKGIAKEQQFNLMNKQTEDLKRRDQQMNSALEEARANVKKGLDEDRKNIIGSYDREKQAMVAAREDAESRSQFNRKTVEGSLKTQLEDEHNLRVQAEALGKSKHYDTVETLKAEENATLDAKRDELQRAIDLQRTKYEDRWAQRREEVDNGNKNFRDQVNNRQDSEVRSRDIRIKELENKLNGTIVQSERRKNLEESHIKTDYEKRFTGLESEKNQIEEQMNERTHHKVNQVSDEDGRMFRRAQREHQDEVALLNSRHKIDREMLNETHEAQLDHTKTFADRRVDKIQKTANEAIRETNNLHERAVEGLQGVYADRIEAQETNHALEQNRTQAVLTGRFKGIEKSYQSKIDQMQDAYEGKIAQMTENFEKDKKRLEETSAQRLADEQKGRKLDRESVAQKYEARIAANDERYREELDRMNKQHQEDIKTIAARYSRKA